jgi:drug/metabolite transporter (DMT)-like permease
MGIVYIVWGSTYLAIRVTVETLPPLTSAGIRFLVAGALTGAVLALRRGPRVLALSRRELGAAAIVGTMLLVGGVGLITLAETRVPSNIAAVLASTTAIWVVVYRLLGGDRLTPLAVAGVAAGFGGVAILLLSGARPEDVPIPWLILCLACALSWSSGSYYGRGLPLPADPFVAAVYEMLAGGLLLVAIGLAAGEGGDLVNADVSLESAGALAYLVVAGAVAFSAYVWLLEHLPISTVVTHQYVNPVVAVLLGWAILSEPVTATVLAGAALVVGAVALIVREDARRPGGRAARHR